MRRGDSVAHWLDEWEMLVRGNGVLTTEGWCPCQCQALNDAGGFLARQSVLVLGWDCLRLCPEMCVVADAACCIAVRGKL